MREVLLFLQLDRFVVLCLNHLTSLQFTSIIFEWDGAAFWKTFPKSGKEMVFQTGYEKLAATFNILMAQGE